MMRVVASGLGGLLRLTVVVTEDHDDWLAVEARTMAPRAMARQGFKLAELHRAVA